MGVVYKAVDSFLERDVALKVAQTSSIVAGQPDKTGLAQCLKEARLAAKFIHPNIAITYDAGIEKDLFFMALEYIDGAGLHEHTRKPNLLPRLQVLEIIFNACYALDYIHNKEYLHLDIKPSNIMLTKKGEVKLMDFGISRFLKEDPGEEAGMWGTPYYMSPEQTKPGAKLDRQTDIFSLGVVLYELLTGKRPFTGENAYQIFYKVVHAVPVPVREYIPDISPDVEQVVERALSKKKEDRFKTAKEFADSLQPILKGKDSTSLDKQGKKKIEYLKRLPFFRHFQDSELREVVRISSWKFFLREKWIIENKEKDSNIYFIVQGRAQLHVRGEVKGLNKGECFGETAILYNMARQAKVMAETDCVVMAINANILKQSEDAIQVKFLREFYNNKILQLVDANLKLIRAGKPERTP